MSKLINYMKIGQTMFMSFIGKRRIIRHGFLGLLSGVCNFLLINSITRVIGLIVSGKLTTVSKENIIAFALIISTFVWVRRTFSILVIDLSQTVLWRLRTEVMFLVLNANYQQLSSRKDKIYSTMLEDVHTLTEASLSVIQFCTSCILSAACLIYLASISFLLFCITLCVVVFGVTVYRYNTIRNSRKFKAGRECEDRFHEELISMLDGAKEIYIEPRKGQHIYEQNITRISKEAYAYNMEAYTSFLNNQITGQVTFYMLICSVLLYFSITLHIKTPDVVSFVFLLLYLLNSVEMIMAMLPGFIRAGVASDRLAGLKRDLEESKVYNPIPDRYILKDEFRTIEVGGLVYYYGDRETSYGIGPIDLEIRKGDVVFIYGSNGSGKTTLVYSILGLLMPVAGEIRLNGDLISEKSYSEYRTIFSVVFSDFYLFNEIIGLTRFDPEKWDYYLNLFELGGKVSLEGRVLSTTKLSTGQRKRLALVVALMEEKPVLVMDEWAADQDPGFRRKFYMEVLPLLKAEGVTVIAITHDDKYYHCASRLYRMDQGKLLDMSVAVYETAEIK